MEYRKWYDKDIKTSLLGFGAMRLKTISVNEKEEIDEEKGFKLFDEAYNNGVNYFDTAVPYTNGMNEAFVGKALKRYPRDTFYLASKLSLPCYKTKEDIEKAIDNQLKNLQTDHIDFYLLHALNKDRFERIKEWNILDLVEKWKKEGKIRHIGFSFHDSYEVFKEIVDYYSWEFCQIQLNYMDDDIQQGLKGYYDLEERKIPVIVMEPIKGGSLSNFNSTVAKNFTDYSDNSLSSWALRWVGSLEGVKVMLSGMNEMEQVKDNLKTVTPFVKLNAEELALVKKVKADLQKVVEVGCTKCRYCMPCPMGVEIPGNFEVFNRYAMYQNENEAKWRFNNLKNDKKDASVCVDCKKCLPKCPQGINIPQELKRIKEKFNL